MKQLARRAASLPLILALIAASAPQEALAIAVRGAAPAAHGTAPVGLPGAVHGITPLSSSLPLSSLDLAGTPNAAALAPALPSSRFAAAAVPAAAADAPQAPRAPASSGETEAPKLSVADPAAASVPGAGPAAPAPGEAAAAASRPRASALGSLKSLLGRFGAGTLSAVADAGAGGRKVFDGSRSPEGAASEASLASEGAATRWVLKRFEKHAARRALTRDEFGGPKALGPGPRSRDALYGLKWGLNMVGIVALYDVALAPLLAAVPWPAFFSDAVLEGFGRVALLADLGPSEIAAALSLSPATFLGLPLIATAGLALAAGPLAAALSRKGVLASRPRLLKAAVYAVVAGLGALAFAAAPGSFLGMSLPVMVGMEEVNYRVISFLPVFIGLALTRPLLNWLADHVQALPDHAGMRRGAQTLLRLIGGTVAWFAYPLAALAASWSFASAHFPAWGMDPYVFAVQFTLGLVLTRVAYRSESLTAPVVAHLTFNLLTLGALALAGAGMTGLALTYGALLPVLGGVWLLYGWLAHRRDLAKAKQGLYPAANGLGLLLMAGLLGLGTVSTGERASALTHWSGDRSALVRLVQDSGVRAGVPQGGAAAQAAARAQAAAEAAPAVRESRADVIARVSPSVLRVRIPNASGTGFILSPEGLAVTNGHVVGPTPVGDFVLVDIEGMPPLRARVLAVNHDRDIALLQLPRHPGGAWRALPLAQTAPRPGEETIAIGFPMGLDKTVTHGIVSGLGRHMNMYVAHIQTDAPINPGNSGGPLFNERGEVIGINTLIVSRSGGSVGLGFAIMGPDLARTLAQYAATGDISSGRLGVIANLSDPLKPESGLAIEYVRPGSGAARAGLQRGDLLMRVGDALLLDAGGEDAARALAAALAKTVPGQKVPVVVLRGDTTVTVEVAIDAKPSHPSH